MKTCRYAPMETCRYTPMWSCRYAPHEDMPVYSHVVMPVCSHGDMPLCSHGDMPVCSHGDMPVCSHGDMWVCLQCTVVEHSFPKHPNVLDGSSKGKGFPPPPFLLRWHHLELPAPPYAQLAPPTPFVTCTQKETTSNLTTKHYYPTTVFGQIN